MGSIKVHQHDVFNESGTRLALHHYSNSNLDSNARFASSRMDGLKVRPASVILSHGTFSNGRSCSGLASYLAKNGFNCWVLEFQGHGESDLPKTEPDFESMCLEDVHAAIGYVLEQKPENSIYWVGHSGGGLAILMYLARNPHQQSKVVKVVALASQATHAGSNFKKRLAIKLASLVTRLFGMAPGRLLRIGPENEFARVMLQWFSWSLSRRWTGSDGFDYVSALEKIKIPLQVFAGVGDTFIAPAQGCSYIYDACASSEKELNYCGKDKGFAEDYTHSRIIHSSNAAREIWPMIACWLNNPDSQSEIK